MKLTKQELKSLIKEEIRISEAGITPKKGPLIALAAGGGLLAMAGLTGIGAPVAAGALAGAGFVSSMLKD
jgi:predicted phage tail protein